MALSLSYHSEPVGLEQSQRTYHGVLIGLRYVVLHFIVIATFLILAFCTRASMLTAIVVALIELGVGLALARDRKRPTWLSEAATLFVSTSADSGHEDRPPSIRVSPTPRPGPRFSPTASPPSGS